MTASRYHTSHEKCHLLTLKARQAIYSPNCSPFLSSLQLFPVYIWQAHSYLSPYALTADRAV